MKKLLVLTAWLFFTVSAIAQIEVDVTQPPYNATPNGGGNDGAAFESALNAVAANANGGIVRIPAGAYDIDRRLFVKTKVDIRGAGMYATRLTLTTAGAGISFQDVSATAGNPPLGGTSGHFLLTGAGLATNPLYVGFGTGRTFERIRAEDAAGVTMKLESVQNSRFVALQVVKSNTAENVTIDYSSQNLSFYDCAFSNYWTDAVLIKQTGPAALVPGVARCSKIRFFGGIIEVDQSPGGAAIAVTDGTDILVDSLGTSGGGGVRLVRTATGAIIDRVTLRNLELQSDAAAPCLEVKGGTVTSPINVFVESGLNFRSGVVAIETDDYAVVHAVSYSSGITTFYDNLGGVKPQEQVVRDLGSYKNALTASVSSIVDDTYGAEERDTLNNLRARVNEIEDRLQFSGLLK